ncbi:MAG: DUF2202 domain-containing protein [Sulfuricurvum sp.]|jgi:hypothetical protein|uniref:ferritin-like domain-containing protein n=1 Tax=Sulfuricurvum sp. TaxID=2025608 RepID=UPI0025E400C6|nr:DUF2202 domain-containing protein [Sulfuricurvum sp.]MCK9373961.1 DUF2202 domain-containing protein [Sulfuricurvum sp.]
MKFLKEIMTLSLTLSAGMVFLGCGGGGDSVTAGTTAATTTTLSGTVADGYLVGAKVCLDKNRNDLCDADEPFVLTDATGRYTFILPDKDATILPIVVEADENTTDLDTNTSIGKKWHFKAVAGQGRFISPLSTLVAQEMEWNTTLTVEQAMANLQKELGIDINASVDYIAANHTKAHNAAKIIAHSLANTETDLTTLAPAVHPRLIRLLAAKQIRSQIARIQSNAIDGNISYLCDVNTTDVATQIAELNTTIASSLSPQLQADLLFMWEEERLARDVYLVMYAKWGAKVFTNIANNGEQVHMESLKSMIDKYGVSTTGYKEPAQPGVFVNQDLQALYTTLVTTGNLSLTEAYKVGVLIEQTDIADLDQRLLPSDLPSDIRAVYENLRKGSENHLAAFNKQL